MAMEPINIFSRRIDPRGVLAVLRALDSDVDIVGPDDDWETATITIEREDREPFTLTFRHNSEYYDGPDWSRQVLGKQGYLSRFPDGERKADVLRLIDTFRFALATEWQPDLDPDEDERLEVLFAITDHLDGVIFTPSALRDSVGRILIAADGECDPDAEFPLLPEANESSEEWHDDDYDDDEEDEPDPPTAVRVVRRALALTAVTARALAEQANPTDEGVEEYRRDILQWVEALDLGDELEPNEWQVLQRPVGQLDPQSTINSTWRLEGLAVMAWALGRFELPPYDELVDPQELFGAMCFLDVPQAQQLLAEPQLHSPEELAELQKQSLAVHWRLRDYTLRPQSMDFRDFAENCWFGPLNIRPFRLIDGDLALGEFAIDNAPDNVFSSAHSSAMERHQAVNWLTWGGEIYSETDTST